MNANEQGMTRTRSLHVRRADEDLDGLIDHILDLLKPEGATVDTSRHDASGNVIYVMSDIGRGAS